MLTPHQRQAFARDGYLVLPGIIPHSLLDAVCAAYEERLAQLEGTLGLQAEGNFTQRFKALYEASDASHGQFFNISLPLQGVAAETPVFLPAAVHALLTAPPLLDAVEGLLGGEILASPVQHARLKPPAALVAERLRASGLFGRTPWHQDAAVLQPQAQRQTQLLTAWLPLRDVGQEDGCLQVIPASHRQGLGPHCYAAVDGLMLAAQPDGAGAQALPMQKGSMLLLHRCCKHASLPNLGQEIRISMDFRYQPCGQPTGRELFPSFVVRSRRAQAAPPTAAQWRQAWEAARTALAGTLEAPYYTWWNTTEAAQAGAQE